LILQDVINYFNNYGISLSLGQRLRLSKISFKQIFPTNKLNFMNFSTRVNGKLLLTGEYFVMDGATALALPTRYGQKMTAKSGDESGILNWQSFDHEGSCWFEGKFNLSDFSIQDCSPEERKIAEQLQKMLNAARELNSNFLLNDDSIAVETHLEFPRNWGLGSSSTLVTMMAEWAGVNPYDLLEMTFKGSGYDIAAATAAGPVLFRRFNGVPQTELSNFNPDFKHQLYFVYLNQKQDSREALVQYLVTPPDARSIPLPRITQITFNIAQYSQSLKDFEELIEEHEELVQSVIDLPRAKQLLFSDYWGEVKSLGAWGGDFVLVSSNEPEEKTRNYFAEKGFETIIAYDEMVLR
jgi:mevalonate kinase